MNNHLFVIKNFFRNDFVNLTIKSIRHFIPDAKIACLNLYKNKIEEYAEYSFINADEVFYKQTKYNSNGRGGAGNPQNSLFFFEGYNFIYEKYKYSNNKILMLAEDHFFTNGQTLDEFIKNNFDIAYAKWGDGANGSIIGIDLNKNKDFFPILEIEEGGVEGLLKNQIINKSINPYCFTTRDSENYMNDGKYSNDIEEIRNILKNSKIL